MRLHPRRPAKIRSRPGSAARRALRRRRRLPPRRFEQVGGFAPELFLYSEDLELGLRIHAAGWGFATAPAARGVHLGGGTTRHYSESTRAHSAFGRGFILGRFRPPSRLGYLQALLIETLVVLWGLVRHRSTSPLTGRIRGFRAARRSGVRIDVPAELIDPAITLPVALRRLAGGA